ncbi:MAG: helix-turn-helix domain-containing protein [Clostridia bacterium]|nr:helix-turn-helix domain-containing protein [Clostridia bacterium]
MKTLLPGIENLTITVHDVYLYVSSLANAWRGDPKGHIGINDVFFYVVKGECFLKIEDKSCVLKEGDLAFLPKGKMRTYTRISEEFGLYEIVFSAKTGDRQLFPFLGICDGGVVRPSPDKMKNLFETSLHYEHNKSGIYDLQMLSNLSAIILEYVTLHVKAQSAQAPFSEVIEYMQKNTSKRITLSELSELAFMQPTYFIKKFREAYGIPPMEYFARIKTYEAMGLLAVGNVKIDAVAEKIGFSDSAYFSRFFKKHAGMSPVEYRAIFKS